jgi:hypothetical protein
MEKRQKLSKVYDKIFILKAKILMSDYYTRTDAFSSSTIKEAIQNYKVDLITNPVSYCFIQ